MKGQLQDMAVADIIQHNCQDRKTARVSLKMGGKRAQLFFKNGNVVHASSGKQEGEEVIYEVINWDKGSFDLKNRRRTACLYDHPWVDQPSSRGRKKT